MQQIADILIIIKHLSESYLFFCASENLTQKGPQQHKWGLLKTPLKSFSQLSLDHHQDDGYVQVSLEYNGQNHVGVTFNPPNNII